MPVTLLVSAHLAETTLVCLALGALTLALRRAPARTRHALWLVVAVKLIVPSVLLWWVCARAGWPAPDLPRFRAVVADAPAPAVSFFDTAARVVTPPVPRAEAVGNPVPLGPAAAVVWLLGAAFAATRVVRRYRHQAALVSRAQRPHAGREWLALRRLQQAAGLGREVPLALSAETTEPALWGLVRPVIVFPTGLAAQLTEAELEAVLAHELAHARRGDLGVGLVQALLGTLLWFHPVVWLVNRRLMVEREQACDEEVLRRLGRREDYLASLSKVVRFGLGRSVVWVPQFGGSPLGRRLEMIRRFDVGRGLSGLHLTYVTLAVVGVLVASLFTAAVTRASSTAAAQATGRIAGTVYDESGAFVPGAAVTLAREAAAGETAAGETDDVGRFALPAVAGGAYTVEISRPGFKLFRRKGVAVVAGADQRVDAVLALGGVHESMTVSGDAAPAEGGAGTKSTDRLRAGGDVQPPKMVRQVPPRYPESAKRAGLEGSVRLEAFIGKDGQVAAVKLVEPADAALVEAAMEAVKQWRYEPTRLNGAPAEVTLTVTVNFRLETGKKEN